MSYTVVENANRRKYDERRQRRREREESLKGEGSPLPPTLRCPNPVYMLWIAALSVGSPR